MAGVKTPLYLLVPIPEPRSMQDARQAGDIVVELCERCFSPVLAGKQDDHMRAVSHRHPAGPDLE